MSKNVYRSEEVTCVCYVCKSLTERKKWYDDDNIYSPEDFDLCPICKTNIMHISISEDVDYVSQKHEYVQVNLLEPCPTCGAHLKKSFGISYIEAFPQSTTPSPLPRKKVAE